MISHLLQHYSWFITLVEVVMEGRKLRGKRKQEFMVQIQMKEGDHFTEFKKLALNRIV